jgi:hypothetical protein
MVVIGDGEEEIAHVYPITCVEMLSEEMLIALREGKIRTLLDTRSCERFEVESGN